MCEKRHFPISVYISFIYKKKTNLQNQSVPIDSERDKENTLYNTYSYSKK